MASSSRRFERAASSIFSSPAFLSFGNTTRRLAASDSTFTASFSSSPPSYGASTKTASSYRASPPETSVSYGVPDDSALMNRRPQGPIVLPLTAHPPTMKINHGANANQTSTTTSSSPTRRVIYGASPEIVTWHLYYWRWGLCEYMSSMYLIYTTQNVANSQKIMLLR